MKQTKKLFVFSSLWLPGFLDTSCSHHAECAGTQESHKNPPGVRPVRVQTQRLYRKAKLTRHILLYTGFWGDFGQNQG